MASYTLRFLSKYLLRKTEVNVVIPSLDLHGAISQKNARYYREDKEKFPLIILLSGFGDDNQAWLYQTEIFALCSKYRVAVAMIGGENKWYLNNNPIDNWNAFITEELPDFLYGNFAKLDESKFPVIGGVSMGGYGALYNGLKNPQSFSAIAAFSPATKPDDGVDESKHGTLKELFLAAKDKLPSVVYISVGQNDFIYNASRDFDGWLSDNKIGVNYKFVPNYGHTWDLWRLEIEEFLIELKNKKII
jgi:S-formylglutathione hydrolase FrmB